MEMTTTYIVKPGLVAGYYVEMIEYPEDELEWFCKWFATEEKALDYCKEKNEKLIEN